MGNGITITYSDYSSSTPIVKEAKLELVEDILFKINYDEETNQISISMADMITDNTELEGVLADDTLTTIMKVMSQMKNQQKNVNIASRSSTFGNYCVK